MIFGGMQVIESVNASTRKPRRVYAKHKAKTVAHLKRMRKKWEKRYVAVSVPAIFQLGSDTLVVHPALMSQVKAALS